MSVKERIKEFAKSQEKSVLAFELKAGLNKGYINAIRVSIQPEKIQSIASNYPNLNIDWLLTGEGEMLKNLSTKEHRSNATYAKKEIGTTVAPLISQYAYAGYLSGFADQFFMESQPVYISKHDHNGGNYVAFEVKGDSMDDNTRNSICQGDIVLGCELKKEYWLFRLHFPKVFVIVHRENGIIIKEVIDHDVTTGIIRCHSWNPSPEFRDFSLNLEEIHQMFYIKEVSRDFKR